MSEAELRESLSQTARRTYERGLVRGSGGNVSVRLDATHMLITASGLSLGDTTPENIVKVNLESEEWVAAGMYVPSKEYRFHKAIFNVRRDVGAIIHCHPPYATAYAVRKLDIPYVTDAAFKQPPMPHVPFSPSGSEALVQSVRTAAAGNDAFRVILLDEHGIIAVGQDLVQAFIFADLAEEMAQIALLSSLITAQVADG